MSPVGFNNKKSHVDAEMIQQIIERNKLTKLLYSESMYQGDCPFCGHPKMFDLWAQTGAFHCYWCGCEGRFLRAPERLMEIKRLHAAKMALSEEVT